MAGMRLARAYLPRMAEKAWVVSSSWARNPHSTSRLR
jgi:hypothetical protein